MKKVFLSLLIAVVLAGGIYAVQAYAGKSGNETANTAEQATVQKADQSAGSAIQCPKHPNCSAECEHKGNCTSDCPNFVDSDGDGKCDTHAKCHSSADKNLNCPGHAAGAQQGCPGHAKGGCGRH